MIFPKRRCRIKVAGLFVVLLLGAVQAFAQLVVSDHFDVPSIGTGFDLGAGVNAGISGSTTRIAGVVPNLRYISTGTKMGSAFSISGARLQVTAAAEPGRFTLSQDGSTWFNFAPALWDGQMASVGHPAVYELRITMANRSPGLQRFSFALATSEGDANAWDFGVQVYRNSASDSFYTIRKRIDTGSSGLAGDLNTFITNTAPGTFGQDLELVMRVTDAGAELTGFHSRVQLSMDDGVTWCYDTKSDPDLANGWRLDGPGRCILWDVAPNAGPVTYEDFSVVRMPVAIGLRAPADAAPNLGASPVLQVVVSNAAPNACKLTFFGRKAPKPYPGPDFEIAVLPDTQNYARENSGTGDAIKEMWFSQTDWIVTNRVTRNIAYVAHLGDIVQNGDIKDGNLNTAEWRNATNAMYRLENPSRTLLRHGIPYGLAVGNHDQEPMGDPDGGTTNYNNYFGVSHFAGRPYYGGYFGSNNDNHFDRFSASGLDFIVFYFEFDRYGSAVLNWANAVLNTNQNRRVIAVMHAAGNTDTPVNLSAQAEAVYGAFKSNPNFFLMLGGHVVGEGSRSDTYNGHVVRTFVSDYQGRTNGGDGWMRLMCFSPSNNTMTVKTYSPWLDRYERDANSQMVFSYDMRLPGGPGSPGSAWSVIGTNVAGNGETAAVPWRGLQPNEDYEWYVEAEDLVTGAVVRGQRASLKTGTNAAPLSFNRVVSVQGFGPSMIQLNAADPNGDALVFQFTSSPSSGIVTAFDTNNGTLWYTPARGSSGSDSLQWQASDGAALSSPGLLTINVEAPADLNQNGLADDWEAAYHVSALDADEDADGQLNWAEYVANTNPTNAASVFRILSAGRDSGGFRISWAAVGGTRYRVQYSEGAGWVDLVQDARSEMGQGGYGQECTNSFWQVGGEGRRFYRVKVVSSLMNPTSTP